MRHAKTIINSFFYALSLLGERIGSDALTYHYGIFLQFHRAALRNAPAWADCLLHEFPAVRSVTDVGCGSGAYAAEFQRRGLTTLACEHSPRGRRWAIRQGVSCRPFDLSKSTLPLEGAPTDVAFSIEVAEHVPIALADAFVEFLTRSAPLLLVTAAPPGQGGQGHINEQPKTYWIDKFDARGFRFDEGTTRRVAAALSARSALGYLHQNLMIFRRDP